MKIRAATVDEYRNVSFEYIPTKEAESPVFIYLIGLRKTSSGL
jgi:hypothetical protein